MTQNIDSTYLLLIKSFLDQKIIKHERNLFLIKLSVWMEYSSRAGYNIKIYFWSICE